MQAQLRAKIPEFDEEKPADSVKQDASVVSGERQPGYACAPLQRAGGRQVDCMTQGASGRAGL